jgi:hypothetical protein
MKIFLQRVYQQVFLPYLMIFDIELLHFFSLMKVTMKQDLEQFDEEYYHSIHNFSNKSNPSFIL